MRTSSLKLLTLAGSVALAASPTLAQDSASSGNLGLEEVVVTAQRRAENVINVPLSIAAATGTALQASGIEDITGLKFQTPGFLSQSGTGYTQLFIRGIGNTIYVGADPSVATFIDDVPRTYGSLIDDLVNVERIEVLKGAQGGLYGRNATGGVVNIITRQPDDKLAATGRLTLADYDTVDAAVYFNVPFSDTVFGNLSLTRRKHDSYVKNRAVENPYPAGTTSFFGDPNSVVRPGKLNDADVVAVDGKLRIEATEIFKLTLGGDYSKKDDAGGNGWVQYDTALNYAVYQGFAAAAGISNPLPPWPKPDKRDGYGAVAERSNTEDYGGSIKAEFALTGVDLLSISALRWNNSQYRGDVGAAPVPMAGFSTDFDRHSFYQEFRAVSSGSGPFRFLGGATWFQDKIDNEIVSLFIGFPSGTTTSVTKTRGYSIYGEASYDLTERFTLTGSLRWVEEKKKAFFPAQAGFDEIRTDTKANKLLPSLTLSFDVGDGITYARYARGFKTGGINPIVLPQAFGDAPGSEFGPEIVDTYEIGYRTQTFNNRVQFTSAIFYNDYKGLQIARAGNAANPSVTNAILNAGTARTYGAEASVTWRVSAPLTASANLGYLNGKYKKAGYPGSPVVDPFTADGNLMALAPEWQGGVTLSLDQPLNDRFRLIGNVLYSYVGSFNHQYEEYPLMEQDSYSVLNLRLGIATHDDRYKLTAFVNNATDEYYTIFATRNSLGVLKTEAPPRVYGATLEVNF